MNSSLSESTESLVIDVQKQDERALIAVSGSASMESSSSLNRVLTEMASEGFHHFVLDLSGLEFICSSGLGALIAAHVRSQHQQGRVVLVAPQPQIRALLTTTKLDHLFTICDSREQALTS